MLVGLEGGEVELGEEVVGGGGGVRDGGLGGEEGGLLDYGGCVAGEE